MFFALLLFKIIFYITQTATDFFDITVSPWVALPASLSQLATKPWTFITYMFSHIGLHSSS
jgi:membrane associated rhomboid family serine protease